MRVPLIRLQCGVNSYDWGKKGTSSAALRFAKATPAAGFTAKDDQPYAELWMGTHPSNPSREAETGRGLHELLAENATLIGESVAARFGGTDGEHKNRLPFLFKVLSIAKALSIQAHPNKALAAVLHGRDPKNYPDDNHKPEMTIAITPFEGLCGFRPIGEILHFLTSVAPLRELVGSAAIDDFAAAVKGHENLDSHADEAAIQANKAALKKVFAVLMESPADKVAAVADKLVVAAKHGEIKDVSRAGDDDDEQRQERIAAGGKNKSADENLARADFVELIPRLASQFPGDIGLFVLFFLNYIQLAPGEAMFLRADDIHAYLSGEVVECMASSDNVVRAGFTPKFKDVATLVDMLTYNCAPISMQKMRPSEYPYATLNATAYSANARVDLYDPPGIEEFAVVRVYMKPGPAEKTPSKVTFDPVDGPSILICTSGRGTVAVGPTVMDIQEGWIYFVGSAAELVLETKPAEGPEETGEDFVVFKAFCEVDSTE